MANVSSSRFPAPARPAGRSPGAGQGGCQEPCPATRCALHTLYMPLPSATLLTTRQHARWRSSQAYDAASPPASPEGNTPPVRPAGGLCPRAAAPLTVENAKSCPPRGLKVAGAHPGPVVAAAGTGVAAGGRVVRASRVGRAAREAAAGERDADDLLLAHRLGVHRHAHVARRRACAPAQTARQHIPVSVSAYPSIALRLPRASTVTRMPPAAAPAPPPDGRISAPATRVCCRTQTSGRRARAAVHSCSDTNASPALQGR